MPCATRRLLPVLFLLQVGSVAAQQVPPAVKTVPFEKLATPVATTEGPYGYLPVTADHGTIMMMLRGGSYRQLDQYFDGLQRSTRQRIQSEYDFIEAMRTFSSNDPSLQQPLEAWRDSLPQSAHAYTALATWYLERAARARGGKAAIRTPQANMDRMTEFATNGAKAALAALQRDRGQLVAWVELIRLGRLVASPSENRQVADEARKEYPGSYAIPRAYLYVLLPRWHGSYPEMAEYAEQVIADSALNPRLVTLRGAVLEDQADARSLDNDFDGAVRYATEALQYGDEPIYWKERAQAHYYRGDHLRGLEDVNRFLTWRHQEPEALHLHAALVLLAADSLKGNQRAQALRMAKNEFEANRPWDEDPAHLQEHIDWVNYSLQNCATDVRQCGGGGMRDALPTTMGWEAKLIAAVVALIFLFNFYRWAAGGFPVPRYIHLLTVLSALLTGAALYMAMQQRGTLPPRTWGAVVMVPLALYVIAIGLGGATWANQRKKQKEAEEAAARSARAAAHPAPFSRPPEARR